MKYLKCNLKDGTLIKFKIRRLRPYGLDIAWKYCNKINLAKYIDLNILECMMGKTISSLEQITDDELINKYKDLIEERHARIKNTKRIIF